MRTGQKQKQDLPPTAKDEQRRGVQRQVVDGGSFASDAVVVHGVDAVGGDVHVEERTFSVTGCVREREDAFDGDAAEGEVFGELVVIDGKRRAGRSGAIR